MHNYFTSLRLELSALLLSRSSAFCLKSIAGLFGFWLQWIAFSVL